MIIEPRPHFSENGDDADSVWGNSTVEKLELIRINSIFLYLLEREVRRSVGPCAIPQPVAQGKAPEGDVSSSPGSYFIPWRKRVLTKKVNERAANRRSLRCTKQLGG